MQDGENKFDAFFAVSLDGKNFIVEIPMGESILAGTGNRALVKLPSRENEDESAARKNFSQGSLDWDGQKLTLRETSATPPIFLSGKRIEGSVELKPGDEIGLAQAHFVVGLSQRNVPQRRALTHQEFRERTAEEIARASRAKRSTALVMIKTRAHDGGKLVQAALSMFRAGDVVAAYATDEIELLFPDTGLENAQLVAERIVQSAGISGCHLGLAVSPDVADHPERLMREARQALHLAVHQTPRKKWSSDDVPLTDAATKLLAAEFESRLRKGPVLLLGEPSVGKAAFARLIHRKVGGGSFFTVHCASIKDDARAAEIFGAGTDESFAKSEVAKSRGGTILIDEVSELTLTAQGYLNKALASLSPNTRIVASSHRDLQLGVERGAFLADLAKTIGSQQLEVPPLRERPDDIVPLATLFAQEWTAADSIVFSPGALARLRSYPWPSNVLELRNAMERAVLLAGGEDILAEHLPGDMLPSSMIDGRLREQVDSVERDTIVKALADTNYNQTHASARLGLSRRALIYKMEKYGLKAPPGQIKRGKRTGF